MGFWLLSCTFVFQSAAVPGGRFSNPPTSQGPVRCLLFPLLEPELQKLANVRTFLLHREIDRFKIGVHNPGAIQVEMY
jgi:hypothetical protein